MSKLYFYMGDLDRLCPYDNDDIKIARVDWFKEKYFKFSNRPDSPGILIHSTDDEWLTYLTLLGTVPDTLVPLSNYIVKRKGIFVNDISTEADITRIYRHQITMHLVESYIMHIRKY